MILKKVKTSAHFYVEDGGAAVRLEVGELDLHNVLLLKSLVMERGRPRCVGEGEEEKV